MSGQMWVGQVGGRKNGSGPGGWVDGWLLGGLRESSGGGKEEVDSIEWRRSRYFE